MKRPILLNLILVSLSQSLVTGESSDERNSEHSAGLSYNELSPNPKILTEVHPKSDLKTEETFSVGYAKLAFGGLVGGFGYPGIGYGGLGYGGYHRPYGYYNPYIPYYGHHGGYFHGHHHHLHHGHHHGGYQYQHHHSGGYYPGLGLHAGIHLG